MGGTELRQERRVSGVRRGDEAAVRRTGAGDRRRLSELRGEPALAGVRRGIVRLGDVPGRVSVRVLTGWACGRARARLCLIVEAEQSRRWIAFEESPDITGKGGR